MSIDILQNEILSQQALEFISSLERRYKAPRQHLEQWLQKRAPSSQRSTEIDYPSAATALRRRRWTVGPMPPSGDLQDRRAELVSDFTSNNPLSAIEGGASGCVIDFSTIDQHSWEDYLKILEQTIALARNSPNHFCVTLRPRHWHREEPRLEVDGHPISAAVLDFGLFFYHVAPSLERASRNVSIEIPALQDYLEARYWNELFCEAQDVLMLPRSTIKSTAAIGSLSALLELDEILYELRDHIAALSCSYRHYLLDLIYRFGAQSDHLITDYDHVRDSSLLLQRYAHRIAQVSHRRGTYALGEAIALAGDNSSSVDSTLWQAELAWGLDGTRTTVVSQLTDIKNDFQRQVAAESVTSAPDQVKDVVPSQAPFEIPEVTASSNQMARQEDYQETPVAELLHFDGGTITEQSIQRRANALLRYHLLQNAGNQLNSDQSDPWSYPIEAALAQAQLQHWIHHPNANLDNGEEIDVDLVAKVMAEESRQLNLSPSTSDKRDEIIALLSKPPSISQPTDR